MLEHRGSGGNDISQDNNWGPYDGVFAMIHSSNDGRLAGNLEVTIVEMVEHPGGHDGGEFEQQHQYGVRDDGTLYYSTESPNCPNDTFCDTEPEELMGCFTREEALTILKQELEYFELHIENLRKVVAKFSEDRPIDLYFDGEVYTEDDE